MAQKKSNLVTTDEFLLPQVTPALINFYDYAGNSSSSEPPSPKIKLSSIKITMPHHPPFPVTTDNNDMNASPRNGGIK